MQLRSTSSNTSLRVLGDRGASTGFNRANRIISHLQRPSPFLTAASSPCSASGPSDLLSSPPAWLRFSDEVASALRRNLPVIALESTIISHGMPYPQNYKTALEVEDIARQHGATPATIAILDGVVNIGLDKQSLNKLATEGLRCRKCSRRDIPLVIAKKENGATTVAATMYIANLVGIKVFVTGGVGGVHRGVEETMDISADLTELGRTPVAVVCAGIKSILDIPKTLEFLETQGVSVIGYGVDEFPAFFTRKSGCKSPLRLDTPEECAKLICANTAIGFKSGAIIAVPVPQHEEAKADEIVSATNRALGEMNAQGITGKDTTPFLLKRISELTSGRSLQSNISLVKNNCRVGAQIAVSLSRTSL